MKRLYGSLPIIASVIRKRKNMLLCRALLEKQIEISNYVSFWKPMHGLDNVSEDQEEHMPVNLWWTIDI